MANVVRSYGKKEMAKHFEMMIHQKEKVLQHGFIIINLQDFRSIEKEINFTKGERKGLTSSSLKKKNLISILLLIHAHDKQFCKN